MKRTKTVLSIIIHKAPLLLFAVLFSLIYAGCRVATSVTSSVPSSAQPSSDVSSASSIVSKPESSEPSKAPSSEVSDPNSALEESEVSTESEESSETASEIEEKREFCSVEEDYFDDALFFGNSRTRLFGIYAPLGEGFYYGGDIASVYDALSMSAEGYNNIYEVLATHTFGKVYIDFGINECGFDDESFLENYEEIIRVMQAYQPDALIYLVEIMYVSEYKATSTGVFSPEIIDNKNELIESLADGETIFYLPVNELVDDGRGYMRADYTGDGVHLTAANYPLLAQYFMDHAIVDQNHPAHPAKSEAQE